MQTERVCFSGFGQPTSRRTMGFWVMLILIISGVYTTTAVSAVLLHRRFGDIKIPTLPHKPLTYIAPKPLKVVMPPGPTTPRPGKAANKPGLVTTTPPGPPLKPQDGIKPEGPTTNNDSRPTDNPCIGCPEGPSDPGPTEPPAPPPPPPKPQEPIRTGGDIKQPAKIKDVKPVYSAIAQSARVQGIVIVEATIAPNGKVMEAKVLRSIPLLDAAALDAVRQWVFTPTLLNGVPVPVIMTVTVNFTLTP